MKILLVYPRFADALWAYKSALKFVGKRASSPPLGLLTVAAMLPEHWTKRLVDMNAGDLSDEDIQEADLVFLSAMIAQQDSTRKVIARCQEYGTRIIAGGPLFSGTPPDLDLGNIDHIVVGEAETSLPSLLEDMERGCARRLYTSEEWTDVGETPIPLWSLVNMEYYSLMALQFARGCPYDCEFCNVVTLDGHRPRVKGRAQMLDELDALYQHGWRGHVFVCDDNLLGNQHEIRAQFLPAIAEWMQANEYPFVLTAAVSIDLADHEDVMRAMVRAGFDRVTVGIESPDQQSLAECAKVQNRGRDMVSSVKKIQSHGLEVQGGFIVGFDSDPTSIFQEQIDFIQESGIVTAMVSLLFAFPGTRLYRRLEREDRLLSIELEESAYGVIDFVPKMALEILLAGHKQILLTIYSPRNYFERLKAFLDTHDPAGKHGEKLKLEHIKLFLKSSWLLGLRDSGRRYYSALLAFTLRHHPRSLPMSVRLAVTGYHFRIDIQEHL
ncbi:B12-binding domain-containing radical SAM protein [Chloroflexota bacterium]